MTNYTSKPEGIQLLISDERGIYTPKDFVTEFDLTQWEGIDDDDVETCRNPDHEWYWEAWDNILNAAEHTDKHGNVYRLHQDGDLFAVCDDLLSDDEHADFWGEERDIDDCTNINDERIEAALDGFLESVFPHIPTDDEPALNEAWSNYTDMLCKDGILSAVDYNECPSVSRDYHPKCGPYLILDW